MTTSSCQAVLLAKQSVFVHVADFKARLYYLCECTLKRKSSNSSVSHKQNVFWGDREASHDISKSKAKLVPLPFVTSAPRATLPLRCP